MTDATVYTLFEAARKAAREGERYRAVSLYNQIVEKHPDSDEAVVSKREIKEIEESGALAMDDSVPNEALAESGGNNRSKQTSASRSMTYILLLGIVISLLLTIWMFRYGYETKSIGSTTCVERVNLLTGDRCLFSGNIVACSPIGTAKQCRR